MSSTLAMSVVACRTKYPADPGGKSLRSILLRVLGVALERATRSRKSSGDMCSRAGKVLKLCFGAYESRRVAANLRNVPALQFAVLPLSKADAEQSGVIRAALQARGTPIGPYEVLIAGQAGARSLTLITRDIREFDRVEGLSFEDWLS